MAVATTERVELKTATESKELPKFGAFIQVFVKRGENIGCLSYLLPERVTTEQARFMLAEILYPDCDVPPSALYRSADNNLFFIARENGVEGVLDRLLTIPEEHIGVDQTYRRMELQNGVFDEFVDCVTGRRDENAQNSVGRTIYAFSYKAGPDGIYGRGLNGRPLRLSKLAMEGYNEHRLMLEALEGKLLSSENMVIVNFDKSATVDPCCGTFCRNKMAEGLTNTNPLLLYFGRTELGSNTCIACGAEKDGFGKCINCHKVA